MNFDGRGNEKLENKEGNCEARRKRGVGLEGKELDRFGEGLIEKVVNKEGTDKSRKGSKEGMKGPLPPFVLPFLLCY